MTRQQSPEEIRELARLTPRQASLQSLARAAVVVGRRAFDGNRQGSPIATEWQQDRAMISIVRAASTPAMTAVPGWAAELAPVSQAFLQTLVPMSAGAALLNQCLSLSFDGAASILLPSIAPGAARFVAQGAPIAVPKLTTSAAAKLTPCKLASIVELTREMVEGSNAESMVTQAMIDSTAPGLDNALFSSAAAVAETSPAGILFGVTPITASASTLKSEAMADDLAGLVAAVAARAGNGNIAFVCSPEQAVRIVLEAENLAFPVLSTTALAKGTVICVALNALASALEPPVVDAAKAVTITEDDANPTAGPVRSVFQTDSIALRLQFPVTWAVRDTTAVSFVTATKW